MTNHSSRIEQIIEKKKSASSKLGGLARKLSGARPKTRAANAFADCLSPDEIKAEPASAKSPTLSQSYVNSVAGPASGVSQSYVSTVSGERIIVSSATAKEDLESTYSTQSFMKAEFRLRETSADKLFAFLDTGASSSLISRYQASTNFDLSEIKKMPRPCRYGGAGGGLVVQSYVCADLYISCTLHGRDALAKMPQILFISDALPQGYDLLIGQDFIVAQGISFLMPSLTAIIGSCQNAQFPFECPSHDNFTLRRVSSESSSGGEIGEITTDCNVAMLYRPHRVQRKASSNITRVHDDHIASSTNLITLEEAQNKRLGKMPAALAAKLQIVHRADTRRVIDPDMESIPSPGPSPRTVLRRLSLPNMPVPIHRENIRGHCHSLPTMHLEGSTIRHRRRASLSSSQPRLPAMADQSHPTRSTLWRAGYEQTIPPGPIAANWSRFGYREQKAVPF